MLDRGAFDRVSTLTDYGLMDSGPETTFDAIVVHAADMMATPMATISLVDDRRQWFKAKVGIDRDEFDLADSICAVAVQGNGMMVVPDARRDRRFQSLAPVVGYPGIRFYAGAPLRLRNGVQVGMLCVMDAEPRGALADDERDVIEKLARRTVAVIEMRQRARIRWAYQGNLGSLDAVLRDEALAALLSASAALEQVGDLLPLALLEEVIAVVDGLIAGPRPGKP